MYEAHYEPTDTDIYAYRDSMRDEYEYDPWVPGDYEVDNLDDNEDEQITNE